MRSSKARNSRLHAATFFRLAVPLLAIAAGCGSTRANVMSAREAYPATPYPAPPPRASDSSTSGAVAYDPALNTEAYKDYGVNPNVDPTKDRFSTFAIDVDTASYTIARRKLMEGSLPPQAAVRVEEFLNYFHYGYAKPSANEGPFTIDVTAAPSPLVQGHHLVRVAMQGKTVSGAERKAVHLVYLVDTSGSMMSDDKIGLAKTSLRILTDSLKQGDTVALCTYAGFVREVLPPTGVEKKGEILGAIDQLTAEGSTAMSSGIDLAYALAKKTMVKGAINHVVVLSDGDANVGPMSHEEILQRIAQYKSEGITLSTVGFGNGNYKDTMMEQLADQGDGNYTYIDGEDQAKRVFGREVDGLLQVIARDVKVQVEFDPKVVKEYRLVGYENRDVKDDDFKNDKVDGGEIGAGHNVTALYDVVLAKTNASPLTVHVRWKPAEGGAAIEKEIPMPATSIAKTYEAAPANFKMATAVMGFAEILRKSPVAKEWTLAQIEKLAVDSGFDSVDRSELIELIKKAEGISAKP